MTAIEIKDKNHMRLRIDGGLLLSDDLGE
jgi:polygalacturonase